MKVKALSFTAQEVNESLYLVPDSNPPKFRLLPKNHAAVPGVKEYTETLKRKLNEASQNTLGDIKIDQGFYVCNENSRLYFKCLNHLGKHVVVFVNENLKRDEQLPMTWNINCRECANLIPSDREQVPIVPLQQNVVPNINLEIQGVHLNGNNQFQIMIDQVAENFKQIMQELVIECNRSNNPVEHAINKRTDVCVRLTQAYSDVFVNNLLERGGVLEQQQHNIFDAPLINNQLPPIPVIVNDGLSVRAREVSERALNASRLNQAHLEREREEARIEPEREEARIEPEREEARINAEREEARLEAEREEGRLEAEREEARLEAERQAINRYSQARLNQDRESLIEQQRQDTINREFEEALLREEERRLDIIRASEQKRLLENAATSPKPGGSEKNTRKVSTRANSKRPNAQTNTKDGIPPKRGSTSIHNYFSNI